MDRSLLDLIVNVEADEGRIAPVLERDDRLSPVDKRSAFPYLPTRLEPRLQSFAGESSLLPPKGKSPEISQAKEPSTGKALWKVGALTGSAPKV
jgi:hypothetical protein